MLSGLRARDWLLWVRIPDKAGRWKGVRVHHGDSLARTPYFPRGAAPELCLVYPREPRSAVLSRE